MTEEDEVIEETEVSMTQGNDALIKLLETRIDAMRSSRQNVPRKHQRASKKYLKRLEKKYYAALRRRGVIGVAR